MSELRFENYLLPSADLGPENPLPPLQRLRGANFVENTESNVPAADLAYLGYGFDMSVLPYKMQDGYNRNRQEQVWHAVILENEILRATFLPELGGRLWSLYHKPSQRELLYRNPVFQPANLATRNAWFSGGVEWNISIPGHSPFTCSPLFAAKLPGPQGEPILRLYEWERARQIPFQIDAYLPSDSPVLFIRVSIFNPHDEVVPMYWWSNIAVPEGPNIRVLTPTDTAYKYAYRGGLQSVPVPIWQDKDVTYATTQDSANDFYFRIPDAQRPWIAALDEQGKGLIQTSTERLAGRKLFVWGMRPGGRRWQEYLSVPDWPYMEIQAGLARTQSQCLPMPPQTEWSWLEAYGLMEAEPSTVHGTNWSHAWQHVDQNLATLMPAAKLETTFQTLQALAASPPGEITQIGSGWGALERRHREHEGLPPLPSTGLLFPDSALGPQQVPWLTLLQTGAFPHQDPAGELGAWMTQSAWCTLLECAVQHDHSNHWLAWLHLGVMHYAAGDYAAARAAWNASLEREPSAWALRNLGMLAKEEKQYNAAADLMLRAARLAPAVTRLIIECCEVLLLAEQAQEIPLLLEIVPAAVREHSRVQLLRARAALELNDLATVAAILQQPLEFADIREGEISLTNLWFGLHEKRLSHAENIPIDDTLRQRVRQEFPPPPQLDFRLS